MSIPFTWIYLIYDPFTDLYKIGKSDDPLNRLKQLKAGGSTIAAAPTDTYRLMEAWLCPERTEGELHKTFETVRVRGEWFDLSGFWEIPAREEYEVEYRVSLLLGKWDRLLNGGPSQIENLEMDLYRLQRRVEELEGFERQLDQARLLGYTPKALLPAPVIDPSGDWPDVVAENCGAGAAAVDILQETGELS